jgi:hypothetical protein
MSTRNEGRTETSETCEENEMRLTDIGDEGSDKSGDSSRFSLSRQVGIGPKREDDAIDNTSCSRE